MTVHKQEIIKRMCESGVLPVFRTNDVRHLIPASKAYYDAGIACVEYTMTMPNVLDLIRQAVAALPGDLFLGAGTALDGASVDLVIQAGFLSLWYVPPQYDGRVMNIHPALLPAFGGHGMFGHHVHEAVLAAGCKVSGCTVHFVTNEYDAGPIIVQKAVAVHEGDDADALAARVFEQECVAYPEAIRLFAQGKLRIEGKTVRVA